MNHTQRMGLFDPSTADAFSTADFSAAMERIDAGPGIWICTSTTRPTTWGAAQAGMWIFETNTGLAWWFNGTTFLRVGSSGLLNAASRTTDFSTANTVPQTVVSAVAVVPAGGRRVRVSANWSLAESTTGRVGLSLWRDTTQLQGGEAPGLLGGVAATSGSAGEMWAGEIPSAGSYTYALKLAATATYAGTSWIRAAATTPCQIEVIEQ